MAADQQVPHPHRAVSMQSGLAATLVYCRIAAAVADPLVR